MDPILDDLNEAQRGAVTHDSGPLLVIAGAGSGKTRVITRRIAWRIHRGLRPHQVLAITFSNKAAGEMKQRVEQLIGPSAIWISTFHALGARLLRMESDAAGLDRNFTIFDADDQLALVRSLLKEHRLTSKEHRPRDYLENISRMKCQGGSTDPGDDDGCLEDELDPYARIHRAYQDTLERSQALDFDDLLIRPVRLLEQDDEVRERFAGRFRTVLIDEYQDTNRLQYRLVRLIGGGHGDVCGTGDPDQSIYRWRGAEIRNILSFEKDFPGTTTVRLEENYRSTNGILKAASGLIEHNEQRVERSLWSSLGEGEKVRILAADTDLDEARQVVRRIRGAQDDGIPLDEVGLLYRTNACSRVLEQALRLENMPYQIVGAVEFYERREIKDLLAYLRVLANRHDELDLLRIINVPARGIGARTVERLRSQALAAGVPLRDLLLDGGDVAGLRRDRRKALDEFAAILRQLVESPRTSVAGLLDLVLEITRYRQYLQEADDPLVEERLENVGELRQAVSEYDLAHPDGSLQEFLNETVLLRSRNRDEEGLPRVTLMTLHAAKGLEFQVVFITALEEGVLPHSRSMNRDEDLEEERRLLYVGITRARRRLTLSYARNRTRGYDRSGWSIPSRFLAEIPDEVTDGDALSRASLEPFDESEFYVPESFGDEPPFFRGDRVVHEQFGTGRVLDLSGCGPTAKVTVDFAHHGRKRLVLEYARLRKTREGGEHGG